MANATPIITPRLVVAGADAAIAVYQRVFGAECIERFATPAGKVVHAALSIRGAVVAVTEEDPPINSGPKVVGGSPVLLHIAVDDPDAVATAMVEEGGEIVISVDDRFYGAREGRIVDPFGHLWIVSKKTETLTREQIEGRMATPD